MWRDGEREKKKENGTVEGLHGSFFQRCNKKKPLFISILHVVV